MPRGTRATVAVRIARLLYRRWERLSPAERDQIEALAQDVKRQALDVRGAADGPRAEAELEAVTGELAEALGEEEVAELREQLRAELERADERLRAA